VAGRSTGHPSVPSPPAGFRSPEWSYLPEPPPPPPPAFPDPPGLGELPAPEGLLPDAPMPELLPDVPPLIPELLEDEPEPEVDGDVVIDDGEAVLPDVPLLMPLPAVLPEVTPEPVAPEPDVWAKAAPPKPNAITAAVVKRRRFMDDLSSLSFILAAGLPASEQPAIYPTVEIRNCAKFFFVPDHPETYE